MKTLFRFSAIVLVLLVSGRASAHQRKEMAGMLFVFGGDRAPNLDNEVCYLEWTVSDLETKEPVTNLQNVTVQIKFYGKEFGTFQAHAPTLVCAAHAISLPDLVTGKRLLPSRRREKRWNRAPF